MKRIPQAVFIALAIVIGSQIGPKIGSAITARHIEATKRAEARQAAVNSSLLELYSHWGRCDLEIQTLQVNKTRFADCSIQGDKEEQKRLLGEAKKIAKANPVEVAKCDSSLLQEFAAGKPHRVKYDIIPDSMYE